MRKTKDWDWGISLNQQSGNYTHEDARLSVLMDIRDELKVVSRKLTALECGRFLAIPTTLERIRLNTTRPKRRKKPKSKSAARPLGEHR